MYWMEAFSTKERKHVIRVLQEFVVEVAHSQKKEEEEYFCCFHLTQYSKKCVWRNIPPVPPLWIISNNLSAESKFWLQIIIRINQVFGWKLLTDPPNFTNKSALSFHNNPYFKLLTLLIKKPERRCSFNDKLFLDWEENSDNSEEG